MDKFSFNIEDIQWAKKEYDESLIDIREIRKNLTLGIETLIANDWISQGSKDFVTSFDEDWVKQVILYEETLELLSTMLDEVMIEFDALESEAQTIYIETE